MPDVQRLTHEAFLYGSRDEFVAELAPFVRSGLERGDAVFAAGKRDNVVALREELGDDAERVQLEDTGAWMVEPFPRLQAFKELVEKLPAETGLSALGEPVWQGSPAVIRQWARYESIINLALADAPMRFLCLYDSAALPDSILEHALHTHPTRFDGNGSVRCAEFAPPERFAPGEPSEAPADAPDLPLEARAFRRVLSARMDAAGIAREHVETFVLAAHEVLTNALRHARAPLRAQLWHDRSELVCRIADSGPGLHDPLAGWLPPPSAAGGGWGLPLARQLCDALEIVPHDDGTAVSLYLSLNAARA